MEGDYTQARSVVMPDPPRTVATFRSSAFNSSVSKPTYVNPECYGDDVAVWLMAQLRARGLEADQEPGAEDFGWYSRFNHNGKRYCAVVGYRPGDGANEGEWVVWLEREVGFLGSLLGRRDRAIQLETARLLHEVLSASEDLRDIRWHFKRDFDTGREAEANPTP
jgi:hypothetical protein